MHVGFDAVVTGSFIFVAQLGAFLRWMYRRMRSDEINSTFVEGLCTQRLPKSLVFVQMPSLGSGLL